MNVNEYVSEITLIPATPPEDSGILSLGEDAFHLYPDVRWELVEYDHGVKLKFSHGEFDAQESDLLFSFLHPGKTNPNWAARDVTGMWFSMGAAPSGYTAAPFFIHNLAKPFLKPRCRLASSAPLHLKDHQIFNISHMRVESAHMPRKGFLDIEDIRRISPKGGVSLAFFLEPTEDPMTVKVSFGASVCSYKDRYEKNLGSVQALARLQSAILQGTNPGDHWYQGWMKVSIHPSRLYKHEKTGWFLPRAPWYPDGRKLQILVLEEMLLRMKGSHETFRKVAQNAVARAYGSLDVGMGKSLDVAMLQLQKPLEEHIQEPAKV
jgi:hypothetical protein